MTTETALQRLEASRASIHAELRKLQGLVDDEPSPTTGEANASAWAGAAPWFDTARRALRLWWRRHPARQVVDMASDAGALALKPLVRTHPVLSLSLAMAAGAAMVVWRPWRSRLTAAVWTGLGTQLTAGLVKTVLNPGMLALLLSSLSGHAARPADPNFEKTPPP